MLLLSYRLLYSIIIIIDAIYVVVMVVTSALVAMLQTIGFNAIFFAVRFIMAHGSHM